MPEDVFWRTMNPARLHALFNSHFARQSEQARLSAAIEKTSEEPRSLLQYLMGGE